MKKEEEESTNDVPLPALYSAPNESVRIVRPVSAISRASGFRSDRDDRNFPITSKWNRTFKIFITTFVSIFLIIYWSIALSAWISEEKL